MAVFKAWHFNIISRIPKLQPHTTVVSARTKLETEYHADAKQHHSKCLDTWVQTPSLFFGGRTGQAPCMVFFNSFHVILVQFIQCIRNGQSVEFSIGLYQQPITGITMTDVCLLHFRLVFDFCYTKCTTLLLKCGCERVKG
jgi:hypothetical protein